MPTQQKGRHLARCTIIDAEICGTRTTFKIGNHREYWLTVIPNALQFDDERCDILADDGNSIELFTEATNHLDHCRLRFARTAFKLREVPVSLPLEHRHEGSRECLASLNNQTEAALGAHLSWSWQQCLSIGLFQLHERSMDKVPRARVNP